MSQQYFDFISSHNDVKNEIYKRGYLFLGLWGLSSLGLLLFLNFFMYILY